MESNHLDIACKTSSDGRGKISTGSASGASTAAVGYALVMLRSGIILFAIGLLAGCVPKAKACGRVLVSEPLDAGWAKWPVVADGELPKSHPDGTGSEGQKVSLAEAAVGKFVVRQRMSENGEGERYLEISQAGCNAETLRASVAETTRPELGYFVLPKHHGISLRAMGDHFVLASAAPYPQFGAIAAFTFGYNYAAR
jgi:hypothetical protein